MFLMVDHKREQPVESSKSRGIRVCLARLLACSLLSFDHPCPCTPFDVSHGWKKSSWRAATSGEKLFVSLMFVFPSSGELHTCDPHTCVVQQPTLLIQDEDLSSRGCSMLWSLSQHALICDAALVSNSSLERTNQHLIYNHIHSLAQVMNFGFTALSDTFTSNFWTAD